MARTNPPFMSGVPELLLLRLLDDREMYGYELVRSIRASTGEAISLGEGTAAAPVAASGPSAAAHPARNEAAIRVAVRRVVRMAGLPVQNTD